VNWPRVLLTWPVLFAELMLLGAALFALSLGREELARRDALLRALAPVWRGLALVALVLSPLLLMTTVAGMAGLSWSQSLRYVGPVLRETHAGHVWDCRLPCLVIVALAAARAPATTASAAVVAVFSAVLLLLGALMSHAIDRGVPAVAIIFIHEAAAALWMGAIFCLWFGARRASLGERWITCIAPWVSQLAGWTVLALLLAGGYSAWRGLMGEPSLLLYSSWGRNLLIKIGAASIVLLAGAYNRLILIPDLDMACARDALVRNVMLESLLLVGVVGLAALLANTPPPHHAMMMAQGSH